MGVEVLVEVGLGLDCEEVGVKGRKEDKGDGEGLGVLLGKTVGNGLWLELGSKLAGAASFV